MLVVNHNDMTVATKITGSFISYIQTERLLPVELTTHQRQTQACDTNLGSDFSGGKTSLATLHSLTVSAFTNVCFCLSGIFKLKWGL